jgi:hypothetical protein
MASFWRRMTRRMAARSARVTFIVWAPANGSQQG